MENVSSSLVRKAFRCAATCGSRWCGAHGASSVSGTGPWSVYPYPKTIDSVMKREAPTARDASMRLRIPTVRNLSVAAMSRWNIGGLASAVAAWITTSAW